MFRLDIISAYLSQGACFAKAMRARPGAGDLKFREILILAEGFRKNSDQKYALLSANAFV